MSDDLNETETVLKLGSELISFIIHNEKIYCGLGNKTVVVLDEATLEILKETYSTQRQVQKFLFIQGSKGREFIFFFEADGSIEVVCMNSKKIVYFYQFDHKLSFIDVSKLSKSNSYSSCHAQLETKDKNLTYTRGQFSIIKIVPSHLVTDQFDISTESDHYLNKPVFQAQEIAPLKFIVFAGSTNQIDLYDAEIKEIIRKIPNPSESINYNCLQKIVTGFNPQNLNLLYKDSRSIGVINC